MTGCASGSGAPDRAEDALGGDEVVAYEFMPSAGEGGASQVTPLEVRADGIAFPSFNKELHELTEEAYRLDAALAEAGVDVEGG